MLDIIVERLRQKHRTVGFPDALPSLLPRFRGRPFIDVARCTAAKGTPCTRCQDACPMAAIAMENGTPALDMGICTFCGYCARSCTERALVFTTDWRLASTDRAALVIRPAAYQAGKDFTVRQSLPEVPSRSFLLPPLPLVPSTAAKGAFTKSLRLRQVTAAGCGACEADLSVLGTIVFDLGRFGMDFVASPRHADALVLTGPVPRNMKDALLKCYDAMPAPKLVIAVGACAISGGMFRPHAPDSTDNTSRAAFGHKPEGALPHLPVDLYIPGCPPHPYTNLDGLLRLIGRKVPNPE